MESVKTCSKCHKEKLVSEFYWRKARNTYCSACKECLLLKNETYRLSNLDKIRATQKRRYDLKKDVLLSRHREWYRENIVRQRLRSRLYRLAHLKEERRGHQVYRLTHRDQVVESIRKWKREHRDYINEKKRITDAQFPEKALAHRIVRTEVRAGRLIRQSCVYCSDLRAHAHHPDYSKPLDVVWLCQSCHYGLHLLLRDHYEISVLSIG
jgi:hypothetical protein